jgi:hypoxanthine-DNA glycosylase
MKVGLPPVAGDAPGVLILGSFPSEESLRLRQYYANPMNQFWRLMGALFGAHYELPYAARLARLTKHRVALWDVLRSCERSGSLDNAIVRRTATLNDVEGLVEQSPSIRMIGLNGKMAATIFSRKYSHLHSANLQIVTLPSSSSAHTVTFDIKVQAWSVLQDFAHR